MVEKLLKINKVKITYRAVDVGGYDQVEAAVSSSIKEVGEIDILINNAGFSPRRFSNLPSTKHPRHPNNEQHQHQRLHVHVPRRAQQIHDPPQSGTILNITSITGLEVPPFPGEAVYHANKACQEAFTNALRNELSGTDIRVLVLRPGCVATHFHEQRVGYDRRL